MWRVPGILMTMSYSHILLRISLIPGRIIIPIVFKWILVAMFAGKEAFILALSSAGERFTGAVHMGNTTFHLQLFGIYVLQ